MNNKRVANHIIEWLTSYANNAKIKGFVIGVSGGVDSAVTASLCARTGLEVLILEMPIHQSADQDLRAYNFIQQLKGRHSNVMSERVNLTNAFESFQDTVVDLAEGINQSRLDLSLANSRARLRMAALYYFAGIHGYLVVGTGNKVEDFGVGFYTKYGDGGVDVSPIADLLKSEVYSLAEYLAVPKDILEAAPTDGLFGDSRTDEDQLGASYDELEWAMRQVVESRQTEDLSGRQADVFAIYTHLNKINQHKMLPVPVCHIPEEYL